MSSENITLACGSSKSRMRSPVDPLVRALSLNNIYYVVQTCVGDGDKGTFGYRTERGEKKIPLGQKRKRGRPSKAKGALLLQ